MARQNSVLFVDDTEALLDLVCSITDKMGITSYRARSAKEAKERFHENTDIKVIFCDLNLGEGEENGLELITEFCQLREKRMMKLCLLTGERGGGIKEIALDSGADEYIAKPINPKNFRETLLRLLDSQPGTNTGKSKFKISLDNIHCEIQEQNIIPRTWIKELTGSTMVLESSAKILEDTIFQIYSKRLGEMLHGTSFFSLKTIKCKSYQRIEKESGPDWTKGRDHLAPHHSDNYLLRCSLLDIESQTIAEIEHLHRQLQERLRKNH